MKGTLQKGIMVYYAMIVTRYSDLYVNIFIIYLHAHIQTPGNFVP